MTFSRGSALRRCHDLAGILSLAATLIFGVAPVAAAQDDLSSPMLRIEWSRFKKLYDAGNIVVIDVRSEDAYNAGHIPGSRSIPLDKIDKRIADLKKLREPIVLYCA